ncbi:MAG: DUF2922 domain-containing protein [Eubacterium sp.]
MADVITRNLDLVYTNSTGKNHKVSIPDYKTDITDAEIKTNAAGILTHAIFEPEGYPLTELVSATRIDTTKSGVDLK